MSFCVPKATIGSFKKVLPSVGFLTLLSFFALPLSHSEATSFATGLVGYWKLDDGGGPYLVDSSGNGHTASRENGVQFNADNAPTIFANDLSLDFDGVDDYASVPDSSDFSFGDGFTNQPFSGAAWVHPTSLDANPGVFGKSLSVVDGLEWGLIISSSGKLQLVMWENSAGANYGTWTGDGAGVPTGVWSHIAFSYDDGTVTMYVNGVAQTSTAGGAVINPTITNTTSSFNIGAILPTDGSYAQRFTGLIDEVRVYNRVLSNEEVSILAAQKSLVGYWKFDETSSLMAVEDSSGLGNNGTNNGPTISTDVPSTSFSNGRSLSFDGVNDYISVSSLSTANAVKNVISFSAWIKTSNTSESYILSKQGENYLAINPTGSNSGEICYWNGSAWTCGGVDIADDAWHHVAVSVPAAGTATLYIDGAVAVTFAAGSDSGSTNTFLIGARDFGGLYGFYSGVMDDLRIYNRALSADEIADLAAGNHPEATWTGEHSIYYEDPNNWDTGVVPDPYSRVTIADAGARPILTDEVSLAGLTINTNASLDLKDKDLTVLDNGQFSNDGTFILDGTQTLENLGSDGNSGKTIYRGASDLASLPTGNNYYDLRIEDPTEDGLVGYWKLDEGSGSTTLDLSGNGNDGTLVNGTAWSTSAGSTDFYNPRSLSFDGTNDHVTIDDSPSFTLTGGYTLSAWINVNELPVGDISMFLSQWGNGGSGNAAWTMDLSTSGYLSIRNYDGFAGSTLSDDTTALTTDTWHQVTGVYAGGTSGTNAFIYIDGRLAKSGTLNVEPQDSDYPIMFGRAPVSGSTRYFDGLLDDVRIYDRALSAKEVANLARGRYAAGSQSTATYSTDSDTTINGALALDSGNVNLGAATVIDGSLNLLRGNGNLVLGSSATTLNQELTMSGGTLTGGAGAFNVYGNVSILTGSLLAPSGNFSFYQDFSKTGGTFSHNNGTVTVAGSPTPSLRSGGAVFHTVDVDMPGVFVTSQDAFVADTLNVSLGGFQPGSNSVTVNTLNVDGGNFEGDTGTLDVNRSIALSNGTLTAPSGLLSLSGSFIRTGGTFEHNGGRVLLNGSGSFTLRNTDPFNDLYVNDGLVGYWNFDETSGTSAADASGYGNAGTHTNGPTISTDVPDVNFADARSLSFDGSNDFVRLANFLGGPTTDVSVCTWIKTTATNAYVITQNRFPPSTYTNDYIFQLDADGKLNFWDNGDSIGFDPNGAVSNTAVNDANWHHVCFTKNGVSGTYYVDGTADGTKTANTNNTYNTNEFIIGKDYLDNNKFFSGSLDDVRIYDRALSAAEIARLAAGNQPATSNSTTTLGAALDVDGHLFLNAGTLDVSSSNYGVAVAGDWKNNGGIFNERSGTVTLDGDDQSVTSTEMFYNFTKSVSSGATLTFASGATLTVSNIVTLTGVSSNLLALRSFSDGYQWNINSTGTRTLEYLDVKDSNNISVTAISAAGAHNSDSGNNTNWDFTEPSSSSSSSSSADSSGVSSSSSVSSEEEESSVQAGGGGGGGGGRGRAGPGGRSTRAEAERQALVDRFKTQVASDETTIPPIGSSARSSRPTIVKGSASSAPQTAQTSSARIVTQDRGHLKIQDGSVAVLYKDVPVDAWFAPYISLLIEENIAQGYKDEAGKPKGEFGVTNPVTYAEVAKMVLEAAGKDLKKAGTPRNLTAKGTWASPYIALAESLQMTVYTPSLDVMQPATRGEVIQSILEAFEIPIGKQKAAFGDVPADYAHTSAIAVAVFYGLVDGDTNADGTPKGTFRPNDPINRAEVAKIIALALKLL